jgi:ABC-2 type transport system permease protein
MTPTSTTSAGRRRLRTYALEAVYEFVKQYRLPTQAIFTLGFPVMFYTVFGLIFGLRSDDGNPTGLNYIALYGAFSTITSALYTFGAGVATERGQGWMLLKRGSPMPPAAYFVAKLFVCLISATAIVLLLSALGIGLFGVRVSFGPWIKMAAVMVVGLLPFCAMGLAIGYWSGPNSAIAIVNVVSMPLAMLSGLWIPLSVLPRFVQSIAHFLPPYHYSQLALQMLGQAEPGSVVGHLLVLVGVLVLFLAIALLGYLRDEDKTYG